MRKLYILLFCLITHTISAQLILNEAAFDVAPSTTTHGGDNNGDGGRVPGEDEFLEFVNTGGSALDISGYQIFDTDDLVTPRHIVPAATSIPAGEVYIVFGGGDVSVIDALSGVTADVASSGLLDIDDAGEVITVKDALGTTDLIVFDGGAAQWDGSEDQSIARFPSITGDFIYHQLGDGTRHTPGVLQSPFVNSTTIVLNEVLSDPPTGEDVNGDGTASTTTDEFVELYNNSGGSLDITGYKIFDFTAFNNGTGSRTPRHIVPSTTIPDNGVLVVFAGGTPSTDPGFFGNAVVQAAGGSLSLNNAGDSVIITDASDNVIIIFHWTLPSSLDMGSDQSATRSPDVTGNFALHTTVGTGLKYSPGKKVNGTVLSNKTFEQLGVKMYPNPVRDGIINISSKVQGNKTIELFDVNGRSVLQTELKSNTVDVSHVRSGFYLLKISTEDRSATSKIVIR